MRAATALLRSISPDATGNNSSNQLLQAAHCFDPFVWAASIQKSSPRGDTDQRAHLASAYKAALLIHLERALQASSSQLLGVGNNHEELVEDVVHHISMLDSKDELFKSASWPIFIAGAETRDLAKREWAVARLRDLWDLMPFGNVRSAIELLEMIWEKTDDAADQVNGSVNWVEEMKLLKVDWLIV